MSCLSSHEGRVYLHIHKRDDDKCYWACKLDNPKLAFENGLTEDVCMAHAYTTEDAYDALKGLVSQFDGMIHTADGVPCDTLDFFTPEMRKTLNLA